MAIELSNARIRAWLDAADLTAPEPGRLHILGIRGAIPIGPRQITRVEGQDDKWDDSIIVFGTELEAFLGTCDPGKWYGQHPINPGGCAHLVEGGPYLYARGKHKGHAAVVQAGPVKVWRDRDRDLKQDAGENPHWENDIGLNIHAGSGQVVGKSSAACQVIHGGYEGTPWRKFILYINAAAKTQQGFKYWLLVGSRIYPEIPKAPPGTTEATVREG